jgi:hypothetical protein
MAMGQSLKYVNGSPFCTSAVTPAIVSSPARSSRRGGRTRYFEVKVVTAA